MSAPEIEVVEVIRKYARKPKGYGLTGIKLLDELLVELNSSPAYDRQVRMALMEFELFVTPGTPAHKIFLKTTDEGVEPTVRPEDLGVKEWIESMKSPQNLFGKRFRAEFLELTAELVRMRVSPPEERDQRVWKVVEKISRACRPASS